jgi:hypothetical protein
MNGLYYYKLVSPYPEDVTKNCKLTINEIDHNFLTLKDNDIKKAEFIREDKTLVLTRNNGEKLIVPLRDVTYNLEVDAECGESGTTLTISYDCVDGKKTVTIANILTADNLMDIIGSDILTKVITDGTLKGNGTMTSPLGIAGVEKTGMLAPALKVFDLTKGGQLPEVAKLGTRYVTKEYVNDYGYLYNGAGIDKIAQKLKDKYVSKNSKDTERFAWRVPTKADWDALLNSIEPCDPGRGCREHGSAQCHVELGCVAGKFLKSDCGWCNQPACECNATKPNTGCTLEDEDYFVEPGNPDCNGEIDNFNTDDIPSYKPESPIGVDKYGMGILPAGVATYSKRHNRVEYTAFGDQAAFWTTTHVHGDLDQDRYVKSFECEKNGVYQFAECPDPYYSVRLVKDYDGSNYYDSEYIDGVLYKTILFPESGQVWLASNYADKSGFKEYNPDCAEVPEVVEVNDGQVVEKRVEMFINEWNGYYWEKRIMHEGDTIVIENPCFDQGTGSTTQICILDKDNVPDCVEVEIPKVAQSNIEYRVFTEDDCNKVLVNTDDLVVERVVQIIVPLILKEREERIAADEVLSGAIDTEREERISGDSELWEALAEEASARTEVDNQLWDAINQEAEARMDVDNQIWDALNKEINDRLEVDAQQWAAINGETERAQTVEGQLWDAINAETARAQEVEAQLWDGINGETARAQEVEAQLWDELVKEIERATAREDEIDGQLIDWSKNPFEMKAAADKDEPNLELTSKDENPEHAIKIQFNGDFGKI